MFGGYMRSPRREGPRTDSTDSKQKADPALERSAGSLFGREGGGTLVLWAFAYISIASSYARVPWLLLVFGFEKFYYVFFWLAVRRKRHLEVGGGGAKVSAGDAEAGPKTEEGGWLLYFYKVPNATAWFESKDISVVLKNFGLVDVVTGLFFFVVAGVYGQWEIGAWDGR